MASDAISGEELAAIPPENRYYACQQCGHSSGDRTQFSMIVVFKIGFVMCKTCLTGDEAASCVLAGKGKNDGR